MKAREFLARKAGEPNIKLRNLIKEPLDEAELRALAPKVGGVRQLVAPKRRAEAEPIPDEKLFSWLAEEGGRLRRPIVLVGRKVTLGFAADAKEALEALL
jgi:arsenate reductase